MIHIDKIDDYQIFTHNPQAKFISDAIDEILVNKSTKLKSIKLTPIKQDNVKETSFEEKCANYFEENFETLAKEAPLVLPIKEPEKFKEIVKSMEHWCRETNKLSKIKGLVLHSFSIFRHLEHFEFTRATLEDSLKIEEFSEAPIIVVYNPQKSVLLLIRNAESQDLATDIKLGLADLKMFILLFNDMLKESNLKLTSLVAADQAQGFELKCSDCNYNVLSIEEFKELTTFEDWWKLRTMYFEEGSVEEINLDFTKRFCAKITGTVAATLIHDKYIPSLTDNSDEKMESLTVLLTREQMEIVYSQDKHIIIRGGFGCGKTIIAAAVLKKISKSLQNDEKLYYICYDSRSELLNQITKGVETEHVANVTLFHNKERRNLSEIIKDILEKKESTTKINFVVDEYDGEDLNKAEAENLNKVFNESLKQMRIVLIVQPIKKERFINKILQERNRFELLETMKPYQLNQVMRNSLEIHNLVKLTMDVLKKPQTIFINQKNSKIECKLKTEVSNVSVPDTDTVTKLRDPHLDIPPKLPSKEEDAYEDEDNQDQDSLKRNIALEDAHEDKDAQDQDSLKRNTVLEDAHEDKDAQDQDFLKRNTVLKDAPEEEDSQDEDSPKSKGFVKGKIRKLGLDEAQAVSASVKGGVTKTTKFFKAAVRLLGFKEIETKSKFQFEPVNKIGHKISTEKPAFFELGDRSDFQKVLSLLAIFQQREIERSEQVVLHFDTGADQIPKFLSLPFKHHFKIQEKVTTKYEEFKAPKKSILVCSYATFRGLEHPKVTVVIDCDIYYVQPYLVETLARCTSDLWVVVLRNSSTMTKVTTEWKNKQAIQQWKIKISEDALQEEDFEHKFVRGTKTKIINAKFRSGYYEKLKNEFAKLVTKDINFDSKTELEAENIISER